MSSRFAVATQILTVIGSKPDQVHRSEDLANWARTNPVVVRRLLQMLNKHGITQSRMGKGGGAVLGRAPQDISLADIYRAVEDGELLVMPRVTPDESCVIGANIGALVVGAVKEAQVSFEETLQKTSVSDLVEKLSGEILNQTA